MTRPTLPPVLSILSALLALPAARAQSTVRVSIANGGAQATSWSQYSAVSADGRFVAFESGAANLVPGDTNNVRDVFVRDLHAGLTTRVSVATGGSQASEGSSSIALTPDGRFVAFTSRSSNLVANDLNGFIDVFVHDRLTGATTCASRSLTGGTGNAQSVRPRISDDGRFVVFQSEASNLVPADTNGDQDIFLHDRQTGTTTRISVRGDNSQSLLPSSDPWISGDGTRVAYQTQDPLLPSDVYGTQDLWVRHLGTGDLTIASRTLLGTPSLSGGVTHGMSTNGRFVLFESNASDLVANDTNPGNDYFVRDLQLGTTELISVTSTGGPVLGLHWAAAMSADGRKVAFTAIANDVVPGDTNNLADAFVRDRWLGTVARVSLASGGAEPNGDVLHVAISAEGRHVVFPTTATNLVPGDTNNVMDVFLRDTEPSGCGTGGIASTYGGTFQTGNAAFGFQVSGADPAALLVLDLGFATPGLECGACVITVPVILVAAPNVAGAGQFGFAVPNDPSYIGPSFEFQWLSFGTPVSPCPALGGMSTTNRVRFSAVQ